MSTQTSSNTHRVTVEADPAVPIIRITRDFHATPAQLIRAHIDPDIFARWVGPEGMRTEIRRWDARTGGSWSYIGYRDELRPASLAPSMKFVKTASFKPSALRAPLTRWPWRR